MLRHCEKLKHTGYDLCMHCLTYGKCNVIVIVISGRLYCKKLRSINKMSVNCFESRHEKQQQNNNNKKQTVYTIYANNKDTVQSVHPRSLTNASVVGCLYRKIPMVAIPEIQRLLQSSVADRFESNPVANIRRRFFSDVAFCDL